MLNQPAWDNGRYQRGAALIKPQKQSADSVVGMVSGHSANHSECQQIITVGFTGMSTGPLAAK